MVFSERLVVAMESIHPQQLFPDVWLHCVQKCQRKGLLCTGMVLSRAGDIFGRQAGQKQITILGGGESVMLVQGALPSQGANAEKPWRSVKTPWRSSDGERMFLPRPAMQIQQRLGMPAVTVLLCPSG